MKSKDVMYIIFGSVVFSILIIGVLYLVQSWAFERPSEYPNCDVKIYGQFCDDSFESWKWQGDYDVGSIIKSSKYNISGVVCGVQTQDYGGIYIIKSVIGEYTVINGQWLIGLSDEGEDEDPYPNLNPIVPDEPVDQDDLVHPDDFGTYPGDGSNTISGFVFDEFDSRYHNAVSYTHLTLPTKRIV